MKDFTYDHILYVLLIGRPGGGDPGHCRLRGHRPEHTGRLRHGVQPLEADLNEGRINVQSSYQKTELKMCNPLRHIHSLSYFLNFFLCNKCIPVKRHLISRGPKEPAKSKKVRKTIRKKLLNRSANRAGKKLWTGLLERQEKDLTDKGKTRAAAAETSRRSGRAYLNKRKEIEEKVERSDEEEEEEQQPFQTNPVGTTPATLFFFPD